MEHTAEPWRVESDENSLDFQMDLKIVADDEPVCHFFDTTERDYANARRIVACINACAGLDQFALDGGWTATGMSAYAKKLEQQRDELLAALESLERTSGQGCMSDDPCRIKARKAIANAKGA